MSPLSRTDVTPAAELLPAAKPSMGRRVLIQLVVAVLILLSGEVALRAWAGFFRHSYQRYDSELGMIALLPNYDVVVYGGRIHVNSQGLRGPEFSPTKPPGTFRIIAIGDSSTFGLAGEDCPYSRVLETLLRSGQRPGSYEVINAGIEGYDSENALRLLERKLVAYAPDLITVYIGWNDLVKRGQMEGDASESRQWLAYRAYDVYLIRFWRKVVYAYLRPLLLHVDTELAPQEAVAYGKHVPLAFKRNLQAMVDVAERHGIRTVLFTLPSPLKPEMAPEEIRKLYFPHYTVHNPLQAKKDAVEKYQAKSKPGADHHNAVYAAMIESVDQSVGRLMAKLDELKLSSRTVVIVEGEDLVAHPAGARPGPADVPRDLLGGLGAGTLHLYVALTDAIAGDLARGISSSTSSAPPRAGARHTSAPDLLRGRPLRAGRAPEVVGGAGAGAHADVDRTVSCAGAPAPRLRRPPRPAHLVLSR